MPNRQSSLDGLRALAALAVIAAHCGAPLPGGGFGVDVFFVLSGFLITGLLLEGDGLIRFWVRRAARLYPALIVFVLTCWAIGPLLKPDYAELNALYGWLALCYWINLPLALHFRDSFFSHCWSLAIEGQFYLFWPLVTPLLARYRALAVPLIGAAWVAITAARTVVYFSATENAAYYPTLLHSSGLLLGALIAFRQPPKALGWVGLMLILAAFTFGNGHRAYWAISVAEIGSAMLVPALWNHDGTLSRAFAWKPAAYVGLISYGVYLWHYPVVVLTKTLGWPASLAITLIASLSIAAISFITIERWVKRYIRPYRLTTVPSMKKVAPSGLTNT